nr:hypothetical protein [Kiritimatiellia bacterium]
MDDKYFRNWALLITVGFCFGFVGVGYKLCVEHMSAPDDQSTATRLYENTLLGLRGKIYDCNGRQHPMAMSLVTRMYFVDPHANSVKKAHRTNLVHVVTNIAQALEMDVGDVWDKYLTISRETYNEELLDNDDLLLWEKYRQHNRRNVLKESADEHAFTIFTNKCLVSGVGIKNKVVRSYPEKRRMAHVVGFVNKMGVGSSGIELKFNSYLKGADGRIEGQKDARQHEIVHRRSMEIPPVAGADVFLTLDHNIHYEAEK